MTVEWVEDATVEIELTGSVVKFRRNLQFIHFCQGKSHKLPPSSSSSSPPSPTRHGVKTHNHHRRTHQIHRQHHHHGQYEYVLKKKLDRPDHNESHYYQQLY
ncbi:hypothetical protein YC2023_049099 [Brassica napus]